VDVSVYRIWLYLIPTLKPTPTNPRPQTHTHKPTPTPTRALRSPGIGLSSGENRRSFLFVSKVIEKHSRLYLFEMEISNETLSQNVIHSDIPSAIG
jgi:hypothetical protein